jgi:hypothetical protein
LRGVGFGGVKKKSLSEEATTLEKLTKSLGDVQNLKDAN